MKRHRALALVILVLAIAAGCPLEVGKGGRIDVAIKKDMRRKNDNCPRGQHKVRLDPDCEGEDCEEYCADIRP